MGIKKSAFYVHTTNLISVLPPEYLPDKTLKFTLFSWAAVFRRGFIVRDLIAVKSCKPARLYLLRFFCVFFF